MDKKERVSEIIKAYTNSNKTCTEISKEFKIQRRNVYKILAKNNIPLREKIAAHCKICSKFITDNSKGREICGVCYTSVRRYKFKKQAVEYKGGRCEKCNWKGDTSGFDFHHLDPTKKEFELSAKLIATMSWEKIQNELDKCQLLCALCHRLEHSENKSKTFLEEVEKN